MGLHCTNIFYAMCMFIYFNIEVQFLNEALEETMSIIIVIIIYEYKLGLRKELQNIIYLLFIQIHKFDQNLIIKR